MLFSNVRNHNIRFALSATQAPPTLERPYRLDTDQKIRQPYVARASVAPSVEHPNGTTWFADKYRNYSVMQQHCIYWDKDMDGVIWPYDTWVGFRDLGFNFIFSFLAVIVIHATLSLPTRLAVSWIPDPLFRIYLGSIHKCKHGSDSGIFDTEGRFVPSRFEDMWVKFTTPRKNSASSADPLLLPKDSITYSELCKFIRGKRVAMDLFGWTASFLEWSVAFLLLQKDGQLYKEDVRMLIEGSMFFKVESERKEKGWNQGFGLGGDGFLGETKSLPFSI